MSKEAMKLALEAMENMSTALREDDVLGNDIDMLLDAITALREALANEALDKMAENARELGLDYEVEPKIGCVNHDCDKCKALAEQPAQQEPVAWVGEIAEEAELMLEKPRFRAVALYTTPPAQRTWVGLTTEERNKLWREVVGWGDPSHDDEDLMKAIEAKLKEKNT